MLHNLSASWLKIGCSFPASAVTSFIYNFKLVREDTFGWCCPYNASVCLQPPPPSYHHPSPHDHFPSYRIRPSDKWCPAGPSSLSAESAPNMIYLISLLSPPLFRTHNKSGEKWRAGGFGGGKNFLLHQKCIGLSAHVQLSGSGSTAIAITFLGELIQLCDLHILRLIENAWVLSLSLSLPGPLIRLKGLK